MGLLPLALDRGTMVLAALQLEWSKSVPKVQMLHLNEFRVA